MNISTPFQRFFGPRRLRECNRLLNVNERTFFKPVLTVDGERDEDRPFRQKFLRYPESESQFSACQTDPQADTPRV
jgi:hypothetical protein